MARSLAQRALFLAQLAHLVEAALADLREQPRRSGLVEQIAEAYRVIE
jgi:hypothetical protein